MDIGAIPSPRPVNAQSHVADLRGRYLWNLRTVAGGGPSIDQFQQALALDEEVAALEQGLADGVRRRLGRGLQAPATAFGAARAAARRALDSNDRLVEAHTSMAEVSKAYDWNWKGAEDQYQQALAIDPAYATAHQFYAQLLVVQGKHREAVIHIELARRADPMSPAIAAYLPYIDLAARQYEVALREARRAVDNAPLSPLPLWQLGRACLFSGHALEAVEALERSACCAGKLSMWEAELSFARARAGNRDGAVRDPEGVAGAFDPQGSAAPNDIAVASAGVGDYSTALHFLERSCDDRVMRVIALGDPGFDSLSERASIPASCGTSRFTLQWRVTGSEPSRRASEGWRLSMTIDVLTSQIARTQ